MHIIQLTDLHLTEDKTEDFSFSSMHPYTLRTWESFEMVLTEIADLKLNPDLFVITGDLAQHETAKNYQQLRTRLEALNKPVYCLAGNHDIPALFKPHLVGHHVFMDDHLTTDYWQLIFLNSNHGRTPSGCLYPEELERLETLLKAQAEKPALIFIHHHPLATQNDWIDRMMLENGEELLNLLAGYKQVKALFHGHIHREFESQFAHFPIFATPSTCVQFVSGGSSFDTTKGPAYRSLQLHNDGHLENRLYYLDNGIERLYGTGLTTG